VLSGAENSKALQGKKFNTSIPTTLHLDLLAHDQIKDPFLKDNHNSQRWISESNIRYSRTFTLDANIMKYKNHKLVFEGIDTYGTVILNG
jgi:beta-mannosidase